ncbi:hypothetical protein [Pedobacter sp. GR22-6]|uniref:hypothetical protein n=1 Tax=Pedobacter sp. GR22-6 TaxID=3127957 RepID=UPI00307DE80D
METLEMKTLGIQELDAREMQELEGGIWIEAAGLALAVFAFGYSIGKDLAEADRRNH